MASQKRQDNDARQKRLAAEAEAERAAEARRLAIRLTAAVVAGVAILGAIFLIANSGGSSSSSSTGPGDAGKYQFAVGKPGPGAKAPAIKLPSTAGGTFDLGARRGRSVLLYFQEGLTCEPCWTQLKDLDQQMHSLKALGVDDLVTITSDPLDQLSQKVADEGITTPVLSDASLTASTAYTANEYGMMGTSRDGHTFLLVGPDGRIEWRADYGGPPNFTMYVPVPDLLADLQTGLTEARSGRNG